LWLSCCQVCISMQLPRNWVRSVRVTLLVSKLIAAEPTAVLLYITATGSAINSRACVVILCCRQHCYQPCDIRHIAAARGYPTIYNPALKANLAALGAGCQPTLLFYSPAAGSR
jgi:hypothetical protein